MALIDITADPHFEDLFNKAFRIIDSVELYGAPKMAWTLGGGTALAMRFQHRISEDLDIFITDAQYIGYLTPRKNPQAEKETQEYDEQSNFVKLYFDNHQIDFIVAPSLTELKPAPMLVFGRMIDIETPAEIVAKKLYYRASALKGRDLFDLACAITNMPELCDNLAPFAKGKRDAIMARLTMAEKIIYEEYQALQQAYGGPQFGTAMSILKEIAS